MIHARSEGTSFLGKKTTCKAHLVWAVSITFIKSMLSKSVIRNTLPSAQADMERSIPVKLSASQFWLCMWRLTCGVKVRPTMAWIFPGSNCSRRGMHHSHTINNGVTPFVWRLHLAPLSKNIYSLSLWTILTAPAIVWSSIEVDSNWIRLKTVDRLLHSRPIFMYFGIWKYLTVMLASNIQNNILVATFINQFAGSN